MKYLFRVILSFLIFVGCNKPPKTAQNQAAVQVLGKLLDQKEYFRLEAQLNRCKGSIDHQNLLYFKSYIDNAFNRNEECIRDVDSILKSNLTVMPDSIAFALDRLQGDSYFKTFQYAKATANDSYILNHFTSSIHQNDIDDIKNNLIMRNALKNVKPQETIKKNTTSIQWKKNKIGLIEIPVIVKNQAFGGIFDTRANISSITQTYARKLGLHILNAAYNEGSGTTGITFKTGIGIADSLLIGNIVIRNAIFQIMPDSILYIAPIKFQLNIIIGFPIIEQLGEIDIFKDGRMVIPLSPSESGLHNLALDGLDPVICLKSGVDTLLFNFDSGAVTSDLYAAYFEKYKKLILKAAIKKTGEFGGAGGSQKKEIYVLPKVSFTLGDKTITIDSVAVQTKKSYPQQVFYGNLGQDVMTKFSELVFNFKYMYVKGVN